MKNNKESLDLVMQIMGEKFSDTWLDVEKFKIAMAYSCLAASLAEKTGKNLEQSILNRAEEIEHQLLAMAQEGSE